MCVCVLSLKQVTREVAAVNPVEVSIFKHQSSRVSESLVKELDPGPLLLLKQLQRNFCVYSIHYIIEQFLKGQLP